MPKLHASHARPVIGAQIKIAWTGKKVFVSSDQSEGGMIDEESTPALVTIPALASVVKPPISETTIPSTISSVAMTKMP